MSCGAFLSCAFGTFDDEERDTDGFGIDVILWFLFLSVDSSVH